MLANLSDAVNDRSQQRHLSKMMKQGEPDGNARREPKPAVEQSNSGRSIGSLAIDEFILHRVVES